MKITRQKRNLITFAVVMVATIITVCVMYFGGFISGLVAHYSFEMLDSEVFILQHNGIYPAITFRAEISKDSYIYYEDKDEFASAEYCMFFMPKSYYDEITKMGKRLDDRSLYAFTPEENTEKTKFICYQSEAQDDKFRITASKGVVVGVNDRNVFTEPVVDAINIVSYHLRLTVGPFAEESQDVRFIGQAFVKLTKHDGSVVYEFAKASSKKFCAPSEANQKN